jgi:bifunctional non-homologous end joining protein LigD
MLAERGLPGTSLDGWAVEPKLDGWRALVAVHPGLPGGVAVRTRRGHPLAVPGMEALAATGVRAVLDGELVAGAGTASDFYALFPRVPRPGYRPGDIPLSFWAFDLLWLDDRLLLDRPYLERRTILEHLPLAGPCRIVRRFPGVDAEALLAACLTHDVEGIVLKHLRSTYRPGQRSRHWRKVKVPGWAALHAQQRGPQ